MKTTRLVDVELQTHMETGRGKMSTHAPVGGGSAEGKSGE